MPQVLTPHQQEKIAKFKYCGGDCSPIYANFLSPLAQSMVDLTPPWVPPNVITFMGLIFSLISLALTMYYNPELKVDVCPNWVHLVVAFNLFLYQTLDNMDGKQARKTGSSSPLGMLFDHGIDAMNSSLLVLPLASALGTGLNMRVVAAMFIVLLPFYTTTWEEFYREEMVLGFINGPTEGLLTLMAFLVCTAIFGTEEWHKPINFAMAGYSLPIGTTIFDVLVTAFVVMVVFTVVPQLYTAAIEGYHRKGQHPLRTFVTLIPFVVFFGSFAIWTSLSQVALDKEHILMTVLFGGSIFVEIVTHVMLAHMCKTPIMCAERYTIWLPFILAVNLIWNANDNLVIDNNHKPLVDEHTLLTSFFILSLTYSSWKFVQVCHDVADACNIFIFSLEKRSKGN